MRLNAAHREWHDAIRHQNSTPMELLQFGLDHNSVLCALSSRKFYSGHPTHP